MIRQQKRLDYFCACLTPYTWNQESKIQNIMIGTHNNSIQIYNEQSLIWAAKTQSIPLAMEVMICRVRARVQLQGASSEFSDSAHSKSQVVGGTGSHSHKWGVAAFVGCCHSSLRYHVSRMPAVKYCRRRIRKGRAALVLPLPVM